jgi:hypothetical protein
MPVEIGLMDGTKIRLRDANVTGIDVLRVLATPAEDAALGGFVLLDGEQGVFRVNPAHVVYVKTPSETQPARFP